MKRLVTACGFLLLCGPWTACSPPFAIFEDVGTDPHPPQMELIGVAYQPVAPDEGPAPAPDLQPAEGFVVQPLNTARASLLIRVRFTDVGGDVENFTVRDRDGAFNQAFIPAAPEFDLDGDGEVDILDAPDYFSGTAGTVDLVDVVLDATQIGPHRLEIWAEDSHESRSEKVAFTVQVLL